ncbi:MAG: tRNA-dihydrouridine synthase [Oscillospiraceae bacterium]
MSVSSARSWRSWTERNRGIPVVPQILTNRAEYFVWAAKECRSRGWEQVDLNLGCPSGTVTGKNKGAGLLRQPELLRQLLDGIFDALPDMKISVKTRIGWERAEEWPALLALLETYLSAA